MISVAVSTIVTAACKELNAVESGSAPSAEQMVDGVELLNNILDDYNADEAKVFADAFLPFTLVPNLNPHTIGPAGATWVTTQRPVEIKGIQVILAGGGPLPYVYLRPRDAAWWQRNPSPTVTASYPTDFFYNPIWSPAGRGEIFFWPVPLTAYNVQLWTRIVLAQVTANLTLSLPPGYNYALRMVLAKRAAQAWRKPWTQQQEQLTMKAEDLIMSNNSKPVRIRLNDAGMPSGRGGSMPDFMWPYGGIGTPR